MRNSISRAAISGLAALSLAGALVATSEPAAAAHWRGGGGHAWHGGGHAWHGGGHAWHGGRRGWHGGPGWWGPAIIGGLAAGALAAPYAYGYGYGGPYGYGGCQSYAPIYDAYGNYLGQQLVNGC